MREGQSAAHRLPLCFRFGRRACAAAPAVTDAARAAGVKLLAYTSILHADTSTLLLAKEHQPTEASIRASGVPFTFLRNGWYTEHHTGSLAAAVEHGAILGAAKDGRFALAVVHLPKWKLDDGGSR